MPLIEFKNVTKKYDENLSALEDVSLAIDRGEFVFLVGPSGAGKSTLVKILTREEHPSEGDVFFDETNILEILPEEIFKLRRKVGVVFQDFKLLPSKTAFENVAVALEVLDSPQETIDDIVPNVLNMVGLLEKALKFPHQLSGGEKQRLSIARALAHEPDVLIADEATGMIDPESSENVMEILERINDLGTTVIMATHDEGIVDKRKKRVVRLEKGKVKSDKKKGKYNG